MSDPSWEPSLVDERVLAAMQYVKSETIRKAVWDRMTNSAPIVTSVAWPFFGGFTGRHKQMSDLARIKAAAGSEER